MSNKNLNKAKAEKNDEFYTKLSDIENEVRNYWDQLEGKKILCPCDEPTFSKFYTFFEAQKAFHKFEVKYAWLEIDPLDKTGLTKVNSKNWVKRERDTIIETNEVWVDKDGYCKGDFRSESQNDLWEWADVIITNPPFSLFKEFIDKILKYKKQFIIVGATILIDYFKENKMKFGYTGCNELNTINGTKSFGNVGWFTNLNTEKEKRAFILTIWDDKKFVKYDNYDAYETVWHYGIKSKNKMEIPFTDKVLGVPSSYLYFYCPEQFEILDWNNSLTINNNNVFVRMFIKLKPEWYKKNKNKFIID